MRKSIIASSLGALFFFSQSVQSQVSEMTGFGTEDAAGRDTAMLLTLLGYAPQQLPGWEIEIKSAKFTRSNFSALIEGDAEIKGISTVKYRATYFSTDTLGSFQVNFPLESRIKPSTINSAWKGGNNWSSFYIPPVLRNGLLLDSLDYRFPESGLSSSKSYYIGFKVLEDWQVFDQVDIKISKIALGFFIGPPAENAPNSFDIQGYLSGYLKWRDVTEISITSNLATDIYDWVISLDGRSLRLSDLIRAFNITELTGMPIPTGILDVTLEKATIDIRPVKGIELLAITSLGNVNLVVERTTADQKPVSTEDPKQKDYKGGKPERKNALQKVEEEKGISETKDPINGGVISKPADETVWINNPLYDPPQVKENTTVNPTPKPKVEPATEVKGSKWGIMVGISLPENFRVGDKIPELQFLNHLQLYNAAIYLSSFSIAPQNSLPVHRNLGSGNPSLTRGLNLLYGYDLEKVNISKKIGSLGDLTGINFVCFTANISKTPADISLSGGINFNKNVNIAERIYFPYMEFVLKPFSSSPDLSLLIYTDLRINRKNTLNFRGKTSLSATGTLTLGGAMVNDWIDPLGLKGFRIGGLMLQAGVDFSTSPIPLPGDIMLTGRASVGDISGKVILGIDPNEINKNLLLINVDRLSWNNLITTFCSDPVKNNIPEYAKVFFRSELESARFKFVPPGAGNFTLSNEVFTPGFGIGASGNVAGWKGKFDIALEGIENGLSAGLKATGEMDEIKITSSGMDIFRISGANNIGKPRFMVDLTAAKMIKAITTRSATDTILYGNASVTILGINNANAFINLTPDGYLCRFSAKAFGLVDADVEARIRDFSNPLTGTDVTIEAKTQALARDAQRILSKAVFDLKFSLDRVYAKGKLDGMKSGYKVILEFRIAGEKKRSEIAISVGGAIDIAKWIWNEVENAGQLVIANIKKIAEAAIAGLKSTATQATNLARNSTSAAISKTMELKGTLTNAAQSSFNKTKEGFTAMGQKTKQFFEDFGKYTRKTVEKIYNKSIDQISNGWGKFTDAMKKAFTGGDNTERIMTNGPAFRVITKYQNYVLASTPNTKSNFSIQVRPRANNYLETWQLVPNDTEGSFFLVSGFNALLVTKPWATHLILIPHESDHKDRERMMMEAVTNEPGWYYLKYLGGENINRILHYTYAEVKNVVVDKIAQWVLAPAKYPFTARPGEYGKFKFEKAGDIDWQVTRNFPPSMIAAPQLMDGNRYQFNGEPEQYLFSGGKFRWIPNIETLVALKFDSRPLTILPNNQQVSTVLGDPFPSVLNGTVIQAQNQAAIFIIENGKKRWIPDIETFNMMGLNPSMIQSVTQADLLSIPGGDQIPSKFIPRNILSEKVLYRKTGGDGTVYIVLNSTLRAIPNPATLQAMGYDFTQVIDVTADYINTLPVGANLPSRENGILLQVNGRPEVYIMSFGIRRHIPDGETFNALQLDWGKVQKISQADLEGIPAGPALISMK